MPYQSGTRLPGEAASKLGHLQVVESKWVRSLVTEFERTTPPARDDSTTMWTPFAPTTSTPLRSVWAADGSFVQIASEERPPREVAFVKTALLVVDRARLEKIDKEYPHPLLLQDVLTNSGVFHATVFPLKNIRTSLGSNYDAVRHIVYDSMRIEEDGAFFETLKWLAYRKWQSQPTRSPEFDCPHCGTEHPGLPADSDEATCPTCKKPVLLTDMLGFHHDMDEDSAPTSVATSYMLIMEHLMLFTAIRLLWHHRDRGALNDTLFIKDGPLTLRGQYSKLVPAIRSFLQQAKDAKRPVYVIGQEKSGALVDHLRSVARSAPPTDREQPPHVAVLTHDYIRQEVHRAPDRSNPYGLRTNWGEKVFVKLDPGTFMVLNVPTGEYDKAGTFPSAVDLIGLDRILASIPSLLSRKYEGALFPIELANGIASMSSYPSAQILKAFMDNRSQTT